MSTSIKPKYKIGDRVKFTDDALDNYGHKLADTVIEITSVSTFYCPSQIHYAPGHDKHCKGHPGFDDCAGSALYEGKAVRGIDFPAAFYDWELEEV